MAVAVKPAGNVSTTEMVPIAESQGAKVLMNCQVSLSITSFDVRAER